MVNLTRIYTRTGDDGTTGLAGKHRRPKHDIRVSAYGTVDETNACIGLARVHTSHNADLDAMLARIQNDLFDLGADLATPERSTGREDLRILDSQVERLEREIDAMNEALSSLRSFILPGGTPAATALHVCRTVARRAERAAWAAHAEHGATMNLEAIKYLNRLSDLLFILARHANLEVGDVLWKPGGER